MTTFLFETRWKTVRCDHCGAEFAYRAQTPTPVHCPCCGYYQAAMVNAARREAFGVVVGLGVLFGFVGLCVGALSASPWSALPFLIAGAALVASGRVRMAHLDPNADAASRAGLQQSCVVLREDYELVRTLARRHAEPFLPPSWRRHPLQAAL